MPHVYPHSSLLPVSTMSHLGSFPALVLALSVPQSCWQKEEGYPVIAHQEDNSVCACWWSSVCEILNAGFVLGVRRSSQLWGILSLEPWCNSSYLENVTQKSLKNILYYNPQSSATAAKSLQSCPTLCSPIDGSPPGSPVPGRQGHWSGLPFPSPMHESENWKWSRSVGSQT